MEKQTFYPGVDLTENASRTDRGMILNYADTLYSVFKYHILMDLTYFSAAVPMADPPPKWVWFLLASSLALLVSNITKIFSDSLTADEVTHEH